MEALGAFPEGEWDTLNANFSSHEIEIAPDCFNGGLGIEKSSWFYSLDAFDPNFQYIKQDMVCSSCSTDSSSRVLFGNSGNFENHYFSGDHIYVENEAFMAVDEKNFGSFFNDVSMLEKAVCVDGNGGGVDSATAGCKLPLKRNLVLPDSEAVADSRINGGDTDFVGNQKKKTRVSGDVQKNKKTSPSKKTQKSASKTEEDGNADGLSSIGDSSEEDNASQETNGWPATSDQSKECGGGGGGSGKSTRASRGSATDPQSLYARKRRERINERLRILQKLVPNGTKVDISTMLEEAVHYVKFLQLQIKLLSSDELWMYAPLAYNGMDIGLHQNLSPFASL